MRNQHASRQTWFPWPLYSKPPQGGASHSDCIWMHWLLTVCVFVFPRVVSWKCTALMRFFGPGADGFTPRLLGIQIKVMLWSLEAESQVYSVLMLFKSNRIILLFWRNAFCEDPPGSFKAAWFGGRKYLQFFICGLIKLQKYRRFMFCFCWRLKVYVIFDKADSL